MIEKVEKKLYDFVKDTGYERAESLYDKLNPGKRVRAKLVMKIAGENESAIKLASVIELIHAASLLHDDVIDEADMRRGSASINALEGDYTAIMLGDILYSKGFYELVSLGAPIAQSVSSAVTALSVGEMMDVDMGKSFNTDKNTYFKMIYNKTASLIESSCYAAALLAKKDADAYGVYGKNLGLAFQVVDDVLDITMDSKTLGKPALHDFKEGKTTLPYIYLYEVMSDEEKKVLVSFFKKDLNDDEIKWLKEMFTNYGIVEKTLLYAKSLGQTALEAVSAYNEDALKRIMLNVIEREY